MWVYFVKGPGRFNDGWTGQWDGPATFGSLEGIQVGEKDLGSFMPRWVVRLPRRAGGSTGLRRLVVAGTLWIELPDGRS